MSAIPVPVPTTLLEALWLALGLTFGRAFGKRLDVQIQATGWFRSLSPLARWAVKRALDATHHWWIGLLLVVYAPHVPELYWLGWGLFYDDLPDVPRRFKRILKDLGAL